MNTAHHIFGPSSLERRDLCPGSAKAEKDLPEQTSDAAEKGSQLHDLFHRMILNENPIELDSEIARLDGEDEDAFKFCTDHLHDMQNHFTTMPKHLSEHRLNLGSIWPGLYGTCDLALVEPFGHADLTDFKFGFGHVTSPETNLQLAALAIGLFDEFELQSIDVRICKPKQRWISPAKRYTRDDISAIESRIGNIIDLANIENPPLRPGAQQCKYCKALATCPAVLKQVNDIAIPANEVSPEHLADFEIGEYLQKAEMIEAWIKALKQKAYQALFAGRDVPGFQLVDGKSKRDWFVSPILRENLKKLAKKLKKDPKAIVIETTASPAQIEKAWGKAKIVSEALAPLIEITHGEKRMERMK